MPRQMANPEFHERQWAHRYESHIAPINQLVDELTSDSGAPVPYVPPMYGGIRARLLSVLRDPGPMTQASVGSGFISMENDDPTAEKICGLFANANIDPSDIIPWNAYPWYINRKPKATELEQGVEPLKELLHLLPKLRVVMLHGGSAHDGWRRLLRRYPSIRDRKLKVIETYHTSRQAFWHKNPEVREARKKHLVASFFEAAEFIQTYAVKTNA